MGRTASVGARSGALLLLLALTVGSAAAAATKHRPPRHELARLKGVNFVSPCTFSHRATDDPIVYPGRPNSTHDHTFVGNASTNAFSTLASLQKAATTCDRPADTAAYWMPTLFQNGKPVVPEDATIYYRRRTLARVQPFPLGLKIVAGDSNAAVPQDRRITFWDCGSGGPMGSPSIVPACPGGRRMGLRLHVSFPDCWDGRNLDSPDHKSHMAYAIQGRCPPSHPVAVPALQVIFRYPIHGNPGVVVLASGGRFSAHADFFNAWRQDELATLVERCLNALRHCGHGS